MVVNIETMRVRLEEIEGSKRDYIRKYFPQQHAMNQGRGYFNGSRVSAARGSHTMHRGCMYCYAYGNFAHTSRKYETSVAGHKEAPAFSNMMSGSEKYE